MASSISAGTTSSTALVATADTTGALVLQTNNGTTAVTIDTSQNVGIGTTSPAYKLEVRSSMAVLDGSANIGFYANGTSYTQVWQTLQSTNDFLIKTTAAKYIAFLPNNAEAMRIDSSGRVGIGTTSPSVKFQVNHSSDVAAINASGGGVTLGMSNSSANDVLLRMTNNSSNFYDIRNISSSSNFSLDYNGTSRMTIRASDGVLFVPSVYATTNAAAANVYVGSDGSIVRSTSSLKYKKDVQDATHGLADVLKLRSVTYKGKSESNGDTVFGGFIAEEIDALGLTEFVQYADDGSPDALAYGNMVSLLAKAIQEQQALITQQAAAIEALTTRITALEGASA
jgi:hypothetical protein